MSQPNTAAVEEKTKQDIEREKALRVLENAHLTPYQLPDLEVVLSPETKNSG